VTISKEVVGVDRYKDRTAYRIIDMLEDGNFRKYLESFGMPAAQWCLERGVQQLLIIPLLRNEYACGCLGIYLPADRVLEQSELDLAFSIGQQVSLAVRMTELAELSKESALLQEREAAANDRAAELSKSNVLLRSTLEQLSDERDLHTFPRTILRMAMEQLRARDGVIFVFDKETATLNASEYLGSENSPTAAVGDFSQPFPVDAAPVWANALAAKGPVVYDLDRDGGMSLLGAADWHYKRGNRSVVVVPMFINTEPYGYFGMGLEQRAEDVSKVELGLMQALTQQATRLNLPRLGADEIARPLHNPSTVQPLKESSHAEFFRLPISRHRHDSRVHHQPSPHLR
jgi:GAF domain-containing protein